LFFDAMTTPDNGTTKKHLIFALNVDDGTTNSGWPVDLNATATSGTTVFNSTTHNQRSALAVLGGMSMRRTPGTRVIAAPIMGGSSAYR